VQPVAPGVTDLKIEKTFLGPLVVGRQASYKLTVTVAGVDVTSGPITVTDILPVGLQPVTAFGTAWSCTLTEQTVNCTTSDELWPGNVSMVTVIVNVLADALPGVNSAATVSNANDPNPQNDSAGSPQRVFETASAVFRSSNGGIQLLREGSMSPYAGGGVFAGEAAIGRRMDGDSLVVARDAYNSLWANVFRAKTRTWDSWTFGGGLVQGTPAVAVVGATAYIAARDAWNSYWMTSYTPGVGFGPWTYLAGVFSTDPVMCAAPNGSLYVIGKDNWNSLWSGRYVPGTGFTSWVWGMGIVKGKPSVACGADGAAYVAVRDNWDSL
jgi:hypothetical protein